MNKSRRYSLLSLLSISSLVLFACGVEDEVQDNFKETVTASESTDDEDINDNESDADNETSDEPDVELSQNLEDWFPKFEDTLYDYEGTGMEFAPFTRYPQFIHSNTMQVVDSTAGTDVIRVFEYSDNEIREIFNRGETYFRDDVMQTGLDSMSDDHDILLQLPIEVGHSWESPNGTSYEITDAGFEFETAFGTFNAIEVTGHDDLSENIYYYAENIGLVEQVFNPGEGEIVSTLDSRQENQPEEKSMLVFFLDEQAEKLRMNTVHFGLFTNDYVYTKLTEIFQGDAPEADIPALISENTEINSMYYGNDDIAYIDFSPELTQEMQAGSGVEGLIIQAIVNTVGTYYNVEEVMLTVDGQPYSSGHFELSEGETWPVTHREAYMK